MNDLEYFKFVLYNSRSFLLQCFLFCFKNYKKDLMDRYEKNGKEIVYQMWENYILELLLKKPLVN